MRKLNTAVARYVGGTRDYCELNTFCTCPLPARSEEFHHQNITQRSNKIFHRIGKTGSGYRPGIRWFASYRKSADDLFKSKQKYSPSKRSYLNELCFLLNLLQESRLLAMHTQIFLKNSKSR